MNIPFSESVNTGLSHKATNFYLEKLIRNLDLSGERTYRFINSNSITSDPLKISCATYLLTVYNIHEKLTSYPLRYRINLSKEKEKIYLTMCREEENIDTVSSEYVKILLENGDGKSNNGYIIVNNIITLNTPNFINYWPSRFSDTAICSHILRHSCLNYVREYIINDIIKFNNKYCSENSKYLDVDNLIKSYDYFEYLHYKRNS
jgi:hypothetical protein